MGRLEEISTRSDSPLTRDRYVDAMRLRFPIYWLTGLALLLGAAQAQNPVPATSRFTLALIPDTQRYAAWNPEVFTTQTTWLSEEAQARDIRFAIHLGDITENDNVVSEWEGASAAMKVLEDADLPYAAVAGNHDMVDEAQDDRRKGSELYLEYFPPERWQTDPDYGGHSENGWNTYHLFEGGGQKFLVLALGYNPSGATLEWASTVLARYPQLPTILATHDLVGSRCELGDERCRNGGILTENGRFLWEGFIRQHDQIFLTVNSHSWPPEYLVKQNDAGNDVYMIMSNYQAEYYGGNGLLRLLEFDLGADTLKNLTLSPWVIQKPKERRGPSDIEQPSDARNQFTITLDFAKRFASFQ